MIQINCTIQNMTTAPLIKINGGAAIPSVLESSTRAIFKLNDIYSNKLADFVDDRGNTLFSNYIIPVHPGSYEGPLLTGISLVPTLHIEQDQFLDEKNQNYNWHGHIDWMLLKRSLDGVSIEQILLQRYDCGSRAVAFLCQAQNIEVFHPQDYGQRYFDHLGPVLDAIKNIGMLAMPVVYADESQVKSGNNFVYQCAEVFQNRNWVFPSLGNEYPNNGFDPGAFTHPNSNNYWSRGSSTGDRAPYYPSWDWKEWHGRRDFPKVLFSNEDAWYVKQGTDGNLTTIDSRGLAPTIVTEPIGFWNQSVPNRRSNDPNLARVIGGTSVYFARGANFMSEEGLHCDPWTDVTVACAKEFFKAINQ